MKSRLIATLLVFLSGHSFSKEISAPPPVGLLLLEYGKVYEGSPTFGSHGLKEYCYKLGQLYVIYSINLLGEGYSFLVDAPSQNCISTESHINSSNVLGLKLGLSKDEASNLLGIDLAEGINEIVWLYQRPIHNKPYDDMTSLTINIKNGVVHKIELFNTVTS